MQKVIKLNGRTYKKVHAQLPITISAEESESIKEIVHDLKGISNNAQIAAKMIKFCEGNIEKIKSYADIIIQEAEIFTEWAEELLNLDKEEERSFVDFWAWANSITSGYGVRHTSEVRIEGEAIALIRKNELSRIIGELINNAIKYTSVNEPIKISLINTDLNMIIGEVSNHAPHLPLESIAQMQMFKGVKNKNIVDSHGYGLNNILQSINNMDGKIRFKYSQDWVTFSFSVPSD